MARERMVTRTITFTEAEVISMNIETVQPMTEFIRIAGVYDRNDTLLKKLKKRYETDLYKIVTIKSTKVIEKLYGMTEEDFIDVAKELPPRTAQTEAEPQQETQEEEEDDNFTLEDLEEEDDNE